jgi:hypothetical protein
MYTMHAMLLHCVMHAIVYIHMHSYQSLESRTLIAAKAEVTALINSKDIEIEQLKKRLRYNILHIILYE